MKPKPVSPELANDGEERLSDFAHVEELERMKDRLFGLRAAILGACDHDDAFDAGLRRLVADIADQMDECFAAFEAEHELRWQEQRELRRQAEERLA
jgi:hypothetical protein